MNVVKKMKLNDGSEAQTSPDMDTLEPATTTETSREPDPDCIKMFVGQIPRSKTEEEIREMFKEYGDIYSLTLLKDRNTGISKGCCFITYYTRAAALAAQNALHNVHTMPGMQHPVQMKPADSDKKTAIESPEIRKLFVGMISKTTTDEELKIMFAPYGVIEDCTVLRDSQNNHKGCAFVTFSTRSSAQKAILHLHNSTTMESCSAPIVVKFAFTQKEKEARRANVLNAFAKNGMGPMGAATPFNMMKTQPQAPNPAMNVPNMGNISGLAASTGLNPAAIQNLVVAATNNQNPVLNQLLKAANPLAANNNPSVNNLQQMQNLQTLSMLFSAAAANQGTGNVNPYGAANYAPLNQAPNPAANLVGANLGTPTMPNGSLNSTPQNPAIPNTGPPIPQYNYPVTSPSLNHPQPSMNPTSTIPHATPNANAMNLPFNNLQQFQAAFPNMFNQPQNATATPTNAPAAGKNVEGPEGCNLFIYHLPQEYGDQDLGQTFSAFGNVISAKVFIDKLTGMSKCFGFVSYDNATSANAAIQTMNGFTVGTKRLKVQLKRSKMETKP